MIRGALAAVAFAVAACLASGWAAARDAKLGAAMVALPPPEGYCEFDTSNAVDAKMVAAVEGMLGRSGNRLLSLSADCSQLADWRVRKRQLVDNLAQYQTLASWENAQLPPATIGETCTQMRTRGEQLVADMTADVQARAEKILKTVKINEMKFLGVVGEEPRVCYAAMLQRFLTEAGTDKTQAIVFAMTIVRQKLVYYYLFAPYVNGATISSMLEQHKANVRRLQGENGN
jgi:hypothetical protein